MRLTNLFSTLTPSFFSSKKTDISGASTPQAKSNAASPRPATSISTSQSDADAVERLSSLHSAERKKAEAARGRFQQRLLARLPEAPTHLTDAVQRAEISGRGWHIQDFAAVPTHPPLRPTSTKKPVVPRSPSKNQEAPRRVITKADMETLIAYKKRKRDGCVQKKEKLRIEIEFLTNAIAGPEKTQISEKILRLHEKLTSFKAVKEEEIAVLKQIRAFEKKLRTL